jgi:hypothetical protein
MTGLERELIAYIERLVTACETSSAALSELEKHSTSIVEEKQEDIMICLKSVTESQRLLIHSMLELFNESHNTTRMQEGLKSTKRALKDAESIYMKL